MSNNEKKESEESLLSEASLLLSLSPPRAPPYHTIHRCLYTKNDPSSFSSSNTSYVALHPRDYYQHRHVIKELHPKKKEYYQQLYNDLLTNNNQSHKKKSFKRHHHLPHPHLSFSPESADQVTRYIGGHILPLHIQNKYRDNGTFRSLSDNLITLSIPSLAVMNIKATKRFLSLTKNHMVKIKYGDLSDMQIIHLFLPNLDNQTSDVNGFIYFVVSTPHFVSEKSLFKYKYSQIFNYFYFLLKKSMAGRGDQVYHGCIDWLHHHSFNKI